METIIKLERFKYTKDATLGKLIFPDFQCFTLEDTVRGWGIKVYKHTAIPITPKDNPYKVKITLSGGFNRDLPIIYTEDDNPPYRLNSGGIKFKGIRIHGGNDDEDTRGCILVGHQNNGHDLIWNSAEKAVLKRIEKLLLKGDVFLSVSNIL